MNKSELNIDALKRSLMTLQECWDKYQSNTDATLQDIIADSCVKRFEFTEETSWKLMKKYLKLEYGKEDKELTVNNVFRFMQSYGFILSWERWRLYHDKRNDTAHEYNIEKARELLTVIPDFIQDAGFLLKSLSNALGESE